MKFPLKIGFKIVWVTKSRHKSMGFTALAIKPWIKCFSSTQVLPGRGSVKLDYTPSQLLWRTSPHFWSTPPCCSTRCRRKSVMSSFFSALGNLIPSWRNNSRLFLTNSHQFFSYHHFQHFLSSSFSPKPICS